MVASSSVGARLHAVHGPKDHINPAWFGFNNEQLAAAILSELDRNLYDAPLMPRNSTLRRLRPDVDAHSIGITDAHQAVPFQRTAQSQWWNRTHLDYALPSAAVAKIGFQHPDLRGIGLVSSRWPFEESEMFSRSPRRRVQAESADPVSYTHLTLPTICSV